jgi:fructosamine-3-kinase
VTAFFAKYCGAEIFHFLFPVKQQHETKQTIHHTYTIIDARASFGTEYISKFENI